MPVVMRKPATSAEDSPSAIILRTSWRWRCSCLAVESILAAEESSEKKIGLQAVRGATKSVNAAFPTARPVYANNTTITITITGQLLIIFHIHISI